MFKSLLAAVAVGALTTVSFGAHAAENTGHKEMIAPAPAMAPAEAAASAAAETASDEVAVKALETTLKDGTKVVIEGEMVSVVDKDGVKTPAPDGEHELVDGTKVITQMGKIVKPEAAPSVPATH